MRIHIKTMGCRLNRAEAAAMTGALEAAGYAVSDAAVPQLLTFDFQLVNFLLHTCTVTGAARTEALRHTRNAKKKGFSHIVVTGCGASIERDAFFAAGADVVVDKKNGEISGEDVFGIGKIVLCGGGATPKFTTTRASVKIQDGCCFRCAYCIVPDARGAPVSRPAGAIIAEIRRLAEEDGFREFVLAGVNVATWTEGERPREPVLTLPDLIMRIAEISAVSRIRLSSVEPATTERAIIGLMSVAESKLCHTLHYPLQSADDGVLRLMRRRYTSAQYAEVLEYAVSKIPRFGLGADIITGFPGETDAAFENTREFVLRHPFTYLHVFPYSERPGTPAAEMPGKVPVAVRRERARELIKTGDAKARAFAESFVGTEAEVLVEKVGEDGVATGWTSEYVRAKTINTDRKACGTLLRRRVVRAEGDTVVM